MKNIILNNNGTFKHWLTHQDLNEGVEVTNSVAMELSQNPQTKRYEAATRTVIEYVPPFDLLVAKASKLSQINARSTTALSAITNQYTRAEIDSWPVQESEAKSWTNDNAVSTPLLDGIVANRPGLADKADLVNRVLTNAANYKELSGVVIGKKQHYQDLVDALAVNASRADIDAIEVIL